MHTHSYQAKLPNANVGVDYDERVLPSITTEVLKAVVSIGRIRTRRVMSTFCKSERFVKKNPTTFVQVYTEHSG